MLLGLMVGGFLHSLTPQLRDARMCAALLDEVKTAVAKAEDLARTPDDEDAQSKVRVASDEVKAVVDPSRIDRLAEACR
jgi:hypothetical protein